MPSWWADSGLKPEALGLGLFVFVFVLALGAGLRFYFRKRPSPEELERRRRSMIYRVGKISDGEIIEVEGTSIIYSYYVAGVGYTASQDLAWRQSDYPEGLASTIGPVSLKFDPRNPANSIVICEQWSGYRESASPHSPAPPA